MSRRPQGQPRATHPATAAELRQHPGHWRRVSRHRASASAGNAAARIRTARRLACYEPAGAFDAEVRVSGDDYAVFARWLGPEKEAELRREQARAQLHIDDKRRGVR